MMNFTFLALLMALQEPDAHRVGEFSISFKETHPLSEAKELSKRQGWSLADLRKQEPAFEKRIVDEESFQVVVPEEYSRDKSFGLLVWISPMPSGTIPDEWRAGLAGRNFIAVGADHSGNDRGTAYRIALALDAVHSMKKLYTIDPRRIYVTGFSGGARTAARLGFVYPEIFAGGIYQGGIAFYRGVPDPADPKREFPATFAKPEASLLKRVKMESRHVIVAGAEDFNRPACASTFEVMTKSEGFARASYFEMAGQAHAWADAKTFAKALDAVEGGKPGR